MPIEISVLNFIPTEVEELGEGRRKAKYNKSNI